MYDIPKTGDKITVIDTQTGEIRAISHVRLASTLRFYVDGIGGGIPYKDWNAGPSTTLRPFAEGDVISRRFELLELIKEVDWYKIPVDTMAMIVSILDGDAKVALVETLKWNAKVLNEEICRDCSHCSEQEREVCVPGRLNDFLDRIKD